MKKSSNITIACLVVLFCMSRVVGAAPELINYQGRLLQGTNLVNGVVEIVFRLYDGATVGNLLYQETQTVAVVDGLYATQIGLSNPVPGSLRGVLESNAAIYLELEVGGVVLQPRERITSTAYALAVDDRAAWKVSGNTGTVEGVDFLGTADDTPLDIRVGNQRVLRLVPHSTSPIIIGGRSANTIATNAAGSVVCGGGTVTAPMKVENSATYCAIVGGGGNVIGPYGYADFVGGGSANVMSNGVTYGVIGGGALNRIGRNSYACTVAGGYGNTVESNLYWAAIGGGRENAIASQASNATICAGWSNSIGVGAMSAVIGGGAFNAINASGTYAMVAGGRKNVVGEHAEYAALGGGGFNVIGASAERAVLSGGWSNRIESGSPGAVIGGGQGNVVGVGATNALIAGGQNNRVGPVAEAAAILSGRDNTIETNSSFSVIAGGMYNRVSTDTLYAVIGGGSYNSLSNSAHHSVIAGGEFNLVRAQDAMIGGGRNNSIGAGSSYSVIAGGLENSVSNNVLHGTIGGGSGNSIGSAAIYAVVGGGLDNDVAANASYATIPGGMGCRAQHQGVFLWADSQGGAFYSVTNDEVAFRCRNGVRFTSGSTGANQTVFWRPGDGSWSFSSDRSLKEGFKAVDTAEILMRLRRVPISEWNYKGYERRHIGPMAQDFHAAFGLGDGKTLNSLDLDGVSLAAIQALAAENDRLSARVEMLEKRIAELMEQVGQAGDQRQ